MYSVKQFDYVIYQLFCNIRLVKYDVYENEYGQSDQSFVVNDFLYFFWYQFYGGGIIKLQVGVKIFDGDDIDDCLDNCGVI